LKKFPDRNPKSSCENSLPLRKIETYFTYQQKAEPKQLKT